MAYFRCTTGGSGKGNTLVVTCADDLAGATITCTDGTKTYRKTCPSTAPYEVTFYGLEAGTWTVSATVSGNTYTTTVVVSDYEAELGGFNWKVWVDLSENYTSSDFTDLDDLLSDETAIRELMTIHACVNYLADIATTSEDVETIIGNDLCAKWINLRDYALDTLYANTIIKGYMDTADKYFYGEWALVGQVPKMTSNTAPYGVASADSASTNYEAHKAFDGNGVNTHWCGTTVLTAKDSTVSGYLQYTFPSAVCVKEFYIDAPSPSAYGFANNFVVKGSNDGGTTFTTIDTITLDTSISEGRFKFNNTSEYSTYRLELTSILKASVSGAAMPKVSTLQFYAWQPKGNVPVMTSNTAPYGTASASSNGSSGIGAYGAFDGNSSTLWSSNVASTGTLTYKFVAPICAKRIRMLARWYSPHPCMKDFDVKASNDGTTFTTLGSFTYADNNKVQEFDIENENYYLCYQISSTATYDAYNPGIAELQFYGRELSVSVPTMTSNTAPYGIAFSDQTDAYKAFDGSTSTHPTTYSATEHYWGYKFTDKVKVKAVLYYGSAYGVTEIIQKASDINGTWTDVLDVSSELVGNTYNLFTIDSDEEQCWRLKMNNSSAFSGSVSIVNFYGFDYSEKEFEEGVTKKWLYDHGVELEVLDNQGYALQSGYTGIGFDKDFDNLYKAKLAANNNAVIFSNEKIDLTNYSYLFGTNSYRSEYCAIDLSSFNSDYYLCISTHTNADPVSYSRLMVANNKANYNTSANKVAQAQYEVNNFASPITVDEWWLE